MALKQQLLSVPHDIKHYVYSVLWLYTRDMKVRVSSSQFSLTGNRLLQLLHTCVLYVLIPSSSSSFVFLKKILSNTQLNTSIATSAAGKSCCSIGIYIYIYICIFHEINGEISLRRKITKHTAPAGLPSYARPTFFSC